MRRDQRDLEQVAATERVEAVLHAVLAEGDRHPGRHQLADPGRAAPHQPAVAAALDHQVRHRVGDDRDAEPGAVGDDALGVVVVGRGQRADVPDGDPALPAAALGLRHHHREGAHRAVVGLVDVHVDVGVVASGELEAQPHVLPLRVLGGLPVRHATHDGRATLHRLGHQLGRAGVAEQPLLRERDDLHLGDVGAVPRGREDALERHQPADRVDVHVGAEPGRAGQHGCLDHGGGAPAYVLDGVGALGRVDGVDRPAQRAVVLGQLVADQHLVEVDVGVHVRREQQAAGSVDLLVGRPARRPVATAAICPSSTTTSTRAPSARDASTIAQPCHAAIRPSIDHNGAVSLYRDEGVVLRTQKLGEADRIITLLTRSHGRVRAVGKGVRRTRSRSSGRGWSRSPTSTCRSTRAARWTSCSRPRRWRPTATGSPTTTAATPPAPRCSRPPSGSPPRSGSRRPSSSCCSSAACGRWPRRRTHPVWSSTPSCCARWPWRATPRPSTTAPSAPGRGRTRSSTSRPAARCAAPAARRARSRRPAATLDLLAALLTGDWVTADASDPRHRARGQRPGRGLPAVAPGARAAVAAAGRAHLNGPSRIRDHCEAALRTRRAPG